MAPAGLYDLPDLYDRLVQPGPCEPFYRDLARRSGGRILELACGTGRLTVPLAKDGYQIVALDSSQSMLEAARKKGLAARVKVHWIVGDMAHFDFQRRFKLIVMSCNSMAHLTSERALASCLEKIRRHLLPGGTFAFDVVNPRTHTLIRPAKTRSKRAHSNAELRVREKMTYDPQTRIAEAKWLVLDKGGTEHALRALRLRQFFPDELVGLLNGAGFALMARYGNFDRHRFHSKSRNQICVARAM